MATKLLYGILLLVPFILHGYADKPDWMIKLGYQDEETQSHHRKCSGALLPKGTKKYEGRLVLTTEICARTLRKVTRLKATLRPTGKWPVIKTKKRRENIIDVFPKPEDLVDPNHFAIAVIDAEIERPGVSFPPKDLTGLTIRAAEWKKYNVDCSVFCPFKMVTKTLGVVSSDTDEKNIFVRDTYIYVPQDETTKRRVPVIPGSPVYTSDATLVGLLTSETSTERIYYDVSNEKWRKEIDNLINDVEQKLSERQLTKEEQRKKDMENEERKRKAEKEKEKKQKGEKKKVEEGNQKTKRRFPLIPSGLFGRRWSS